MKKFLLFALIVLIFPLILFGCQTQEQLNSYKIDAFYDDSTQTLQCQQQVVYVNNSDNALTEICFFLYANSFDEDQTAVSHAYENQAYPNGKSYGRITFSEITEQNNQAQYEISENKNILTVFLQTQLFPQESVVVEMQYIVFLANINHRLGYGDNSVNLGNFFPIACVYENGFVKNSFSQNGDPFYSDSSDFEVSISYPEQYMLASTGNLENESLVEGRKLALLKQNNVRDFCMVLSENFNILSKTVGDVVVNYFYYDDPDAQQHLDISAEAIKTFSDMFGKYPYKQLSVVKTNFCFGGMEYPNLVMISDAISGNENINYVIVHEIAHQWWYGIVGNNQFEEAWVDEGLTEFSTALFFEKNPKYNLNYDDIIDNAFNVYRKFVSIFSNINGDVDESMNRNLSQYNTEPEYVNCTYTKGMLFFDSLRTTMRDRKFFKCLRNYYNSYAHKNSSAESLIESFCNSSGINLQPFFNAWLLGDVVL